MAGNKSSPPQSPTKTAHETNKKRKRDDDDDGCCLKIDDWESFCRWLLEGLDMGNQQPMRIVLHDDDAEVSATDEEYLDIFDFDGFFDAENRRRMQLENTDVNEEEAAPTKDDDLYLDLFDFDSFAS